MGVARDLELLRIPEGLVVTLDEASGLPPEQVVFMSTSSQGEPMSTLGRMASRDHRHIRIEPGDTVILASSLVPGNETAVFRVINGLARWGANVVHKDVAGVHVSRPCARSRRAALPAQRGQAADFVPVRGVAAPPRGARPRRADRVPADRIVLCADGDVVDLVDEFASVTGHRGWGIYVDGLAVGDVETALTERRILGDEGFIGVTVVVDEVTGKVAGGPFDVRPRLRRRPERVRPVLPLIEQALDACAADGIAEPYQLQQVVRRVVGKWVSDAGAR